MDNSKIKGVGFVVISAVFYGIMPSIVMTVTQGGGNSISVIFYRFLISIPFLFVYLKVQNVDLKITGEDVKRISLLTVFGYYGTTVLLFFSYGYIATGLATTIHYVYPVLIILANVIFMGGRLNKIKLVCAAMCFIAMVLFNTGIGDVNLFGVLLAFLSSITYTFYNIYFENSPINSMNGLKILFYGNILATVLTFIIAIASHSLVFHLTATAWIAVVILSCGVTFMGNFFYQRGVMSIGAQSASILSTLEPIVSIIRGMVLYSERIGILGAIGCVLILSAGIIVAKMEL